MERIHIGFGGWIAVGVVIVIGCVAWLNSRVPQVGVQEAGITSREVALLCTTDMATQYHIHPELHILIQGVEVPLPADIVIQPSCMNSIHTHEGGGVVHVESPVAKDFTLGDFFAVWKKDFSKEKILDSAITSTTEIVVTVNGVRVDTYENTVLRDKDQIVIAYQSK